MQKLALITLLLFSYSTLIPLSGGENTKLEKQINRIWNSSTTSFRSSRTGLFYGKALNKLPGVDCYPTREQYLRGKYRTEPYQKGGKNTVGYNLHGGGSGTEDCSLFTGTLLAAICDKFIATKDPICRDQANMAYRGLYSAATAHGEPGFIARGVCHEDGKSIFAGTSRDQYTNAIYGLWRYFHTPLSSKERKKEIRKILIAVADKMIREITPENNYSFRFAYGIPDDRGVAKMYSPTPSYITLRLAMIYAAAWDVSREKKYYDLFLKYIDNGIEGTEIWIEEIRCKIFHSQPYVILQQGYALEIVWSTAQSPELKHRILQVFETVNRTVDESPFYAKVRFRSLGEIIGGELRMPGWKLSDRLQKHLHRDIMRLGAKGWPGANYTLIGAYWAARAKGFLTPELEIQK